VTSEAIVKRFYPHAVVESRGVEGSRYKRIYKVRETSDPDTPTIGHPAHRADWAWASAVREIDRRATEGGE